MIAPNNSKSAFSIRNQRNGSGNAEFVFVKKTDSYSMLSRLEFKNLSNDWILEGVRFVEFQRRFCSLGVSPCIERIKPAGERSALLSNSPDKISLGFSVNFAANSSSNRANPMSRRGQPSPNLFFAVSHRSQEANKLNERRNLQTKKKARQGSRESQEKPRMENQMN
jgi:hypothetical protein